MNTRVEKFIEGGERVSEDDYNEEEFSEQANRWEAANDEFLMFKNIPESERPFSSPDLCAFALLDKKFPSERGMDIVSAAEHDKIWLRIESEQIAALTDEEVLYLTRCGVMYEEDLDGLSMFV